MGERNQKESHTEDNCRFMEVPQEDKLRGTLLRWCDCGLWIGDRRCWKEEGPGAPVDVREASWARISACSASD